MDVSPPTAPEPAAPGPQAPQPGAPETGPPSARMHWPTVAPITLGAGLAIMVSGGGAAALWGKTVGMFSPPRTSHARAASADTELERQTPQEQAEILLERAVTRTDQGTTQDEDQSKDQSKAQIDARLEAWRGQLKM